jgi:hypothetical protein
MMKGDERQRNLTEAYMDRNVAEARNLPDTLACCLRFFLSGSVFYVPPEEVMFLPIFSAYR